MFGRATALLLLLPATALPASGPVSAAPDYVLRAALERQPPAMTSARFGLRGEWRPVRTQPVRSGSASLELAPALVPKGTAPMCPAPGTIFSDGFELP